MFDDTKPRVLILPPLLFQQLHIVINRKGGSFMCFIKYRDVTGININYQCWL